MVYPRIDDPAIFSWELNETHSRYDYPRAWPSHHHLHIEFSVLATVNALVAFTTFILVIALIRSKKVQKNPLNLYLLFIAIPDFCASFLCFLTCAMSAPQSQYYSEAMCGFQSFYLNFAFISNAWLNGVIVSQIHRLLRFSNVRRRYQPPIRSRVLAHAGLVYSYALGWGLLCGFNLPFLPHSTHLYYGFACMPMEYDTASTLFFWLVFLPFSLGLPILYAAYVVVDILRKKLLPPTGRRRKLSLFLLRLCFLYFAIWVPFLLLMLAGNFVPISQFIFYMAAILSHLQGMLSALFCLTNRDIKRAYLGTLTCQWRLEDDNDEHGSSSRWTLGGGESQRRSMRDSFGFLASRKFTFSMRSTAETMQQDGSRPSSTMGVTSNHSANNKGRNSNTNNDEEDPAPFERREEGDNTERMGNNKHNNQSIQDLNDDNPFYSDDELDDDEEYSNQQDGKQEGQPPAVSFFFDERSQEEEKEEEG